MIKEFSRLLDGHVHDIADGLLIVEDFERLRVVPFSAAVFAGHVGTRQKIHFQLDYTLALACLAAATLSVKGKAASGITSHPRYRQLRVKTADFIENFDVSS